MKFKRRAGARQPRARNGRWWHRVVLTTLVVVFAAAPAAVAAPPAPREDTSPGAPGYPWAWPVPGAREVIEPFRPPAHAYGPGHRGMDVAAARGTPVAAPAAGVVAFRGVVVDRPLITIDVGAGYVVTLEPVLSELDVGAVVNRGDIVGTRVTGGHTGGEALHVGVRHDGSYVNPLPLFGDVPRAVLLPAVSDGELRLAGARVDRWR